MHTCLVKSHVWVIYEFTKEDVSYIYDPKMLQVNPLLQNKNSRKLDLYVVMRSRVFIYTVYIREEKIHQKQAT